MSLYDTDDVWLEQERQLSTINSYIAACDNQSELVRLEFQKIELERKINKRPITSIKCECGATTAGYSSHAHYCPKHES